MRISDWSSDVCSSELLARAIGKKVDDLGIALDVDHQPHRLANAASAGQFVGGERLEAAVVGRQQQIGRASCRERVCQYVSVSVVAVSLKKNNDIIGITKCIVVGTYLS